MRKPHCLGHAAGVVDILTGAAGALLGQRRAVIVKLQGHADDVIAFVLQHRGDHGTVHAARHGDDDARVGGGLGKAQRIQSAMIERHLSLLRIGRNIGKSETLTMSGFTRP